MASLGYESFYNCNSLESIILPDTITSIGSGTFTLCTSLNSLKLPNNLSEM